MSVLKQKTYIKSIKIVNKVLKMQKYNNMSLIAIILIFTVLACINMPSYEVKISQEKKISEKTKTCLGCHERYTPGIVADWKASRHANIVPAEALKKPKLERRVSSKKAAKYRTVVGCFECHGLNPEKHSDTFDHFGFKIHIVVSPNDCRECHELEVEQYSESKKAYAYDNLKKNPVYSMMYRAIISLKSVDLDSLRVEQKNVSNSTEAETCFSCHGTKIEVSGYTYVIKDGLRVKVPVLKNWPNHGVGRINPDGSRGACTSCHPRHSFSIEVARKPYTCAQCHLDPDVPAWNVYKESKHGNIYFSKEKYWNFKSVPWVLGRDIKTPTCATCHASLLVDESGNIVAERTHDFGSRLWIRLFGLTYAHPQPKHGATYKIMVFDKTLNKNISLPTGLKMEISDKYLITEEEMERRANAMKRICKTCHATEYVDRHFERMHKTIKETNKMTLEATKLLLKAYELGIADPSNMFDEYIEQLWVQQWLFYATTTRYASAMTGAPDYQTFKLGWWEMTKNLEKMKFVIEASLKNSSSLTK